ncbi:MAG: murein biosynthesis integral membrane protein MurJ [Phycisphaerales bacterium]|nr:murein biosynthesis integral membrane protein MurJ [Phycisphaerales bacterium]MCB9835376.1 murein biosynthesis integral membrane protein MurJ [Phycisphaera sp.]
MSTTKPSSIARDTRTVASVTLISRVFGLARDLVTVRLFGDSLVGSAFAAAFAIPNLFRRLLGEGALSAAFIPRYTRLAEENEDAAERYATLIVTSLAIATTLLLVIGEAVVLGLYFTAHDEARRFSFGLIALLLPFMPMVCTTAILGGMLQVRGRFLPLAASPILLSVCIIGAALLAMAQDTTPEQGAIWIGFATLLAGVLQIVWVMAELKRRTRWRFDTKPVRDEARATMRRFVPVLIGMGTLQLNTLMDTVLAMWPTWVGPTLFGRTIPMDEASNAIVGYTQRLYQFPLGVFGIAVATAAFPALARTASDKPRFTETVAHGMRLSLFIGLPATIGLFVVRRDLVDVMFSGGGGFSDDGLTRSAAVLAGYSLGVFAYSLNHMLSRSFYALDDTLTPMRVGIAMVLVNLVCNLSLIWSLREAGLAWSTAISALLQTLVLALILRKRLEPNISILPGALRITLVSLAMGSLVWLALHFMPGAESWSSSALRLTVAVVVGVGSYTGLAFALKMPELRWLVKGA